MNREWKPLVVGFSFFIIMNKTKENYAELLKDPKWASVSKEIKKWDRGVCQLCGNSENLHVHHLCYDDNRKPWDYPRRSLVTLCDKCHKKIHDEDKKFYSRLKELLFKLGLNGVSKTTVLQVLEYALRESNRYDEDNLFDNIWDIPYTPTFWVFGREYKNEIYAKAREREKEFLRLAKDAYVWSTGNKDFNEEDALNGEYDEYIQEYKTNNLD